MEAGLAIRCSLVRLITSKQSVSLEFSKLLAVRSHLCDKGLGQHTSQDHTDAQMTRPGNLSRACQKESIEVVRTSGLDDDWARLTGRTTQCKPRTCSSDWISYQAWECLGIPQEKLGNMAGEKDFLNTLLNLLHPQPDFR